MKRLLFVTFFLGLQARAFVPDLGHLIRHQPMMLKANPQAFTVDGVFEIENDKAPFKVLWAGVKAGYVVEFKKIPSSWMSSGNSTELLLYRDGAACMLVLNKAPYPCSTLRFWGDFEFNSNGDRVAQTIASLGIATSSEAVFKSINSNDYTNGAKRNSKVKPTLKNIQGTFMSVLEFAGANGSSIAFDSVTYAPLAAKFSVDAMMWSFTGSPDFYLEKEENKNNLIISKRIEVKEGDKVVAVIKREPFKRGQKISLPDLPSSKGSVSEVPYGQFSEKGKNFLKALFLTH